MTQESLKEKLSLAEPPLSWYCGFGRKEVGIIVVSYGDGLTNFGGFELIHHLEQWSHFKGNPVDEKDSQEKKNNAEEIIKTAEDYIFQVTGFTPQEIMNKALMLQKEYYNKDSAPFKVELY